MQKALKTAIVIIAIAMVFSSFVSSMGGNANNAGTKLPVSNITTDNVNATVDRGVMSYSANFTYLNPSLLNETKLFMQTPYNGVYYDGNLYIIGQSLTGSPVLVETTASLGNPRTVYTFDSYSSITGGGVIKTSEGIFISLENGQGQPGLFIYNYSSGIQNVTQILPGNNWSIIYTYNMSINYLFFFKYSAGFNHTYLLQYNLSDGNLYNYSSQIGKNSSIEAIYQYSNTVYFTGTSSYSLNGHNGSYPYFGEINVSNGKIIQFSSSSHPAYYEAVNPDNIVYSDGNIYVGGVNFTRNNNTSMFLASYNIKSNTVSNITGLAVNSSVTQLFSYGDKVFVATYNASRFVYINYVGFYELYATNDTVVNLSGLMPNFFDNFNTVIPGYDYLIGWSYANGTSEIVKFNLLDPAKSLYAFYVNPAGGYPQYWTAYTSDSKYGFITTGGNGMMLENNSVIYSPYGVSGFLVGSAQIGNTSYAVGQSFAPNDGVLLYSYNMASKVFVNLTGSFNPSLYVSNAVFLQDAPFGNGLLIIGEDNEGSTQNPILYEYFPSNETAYNLTGEISSQFNGVSLYYVDMVNTTVGDYVLSDTNNGMLFGLFNQSGYHRINGMPYSYNIPLGDSYSGSFQGMAANGSTVFITGNNGTDGKPILLSYNSSGFHNLGGLVANYTFQASSIAYSNDTVYIAGYNDSSSSLPELVAVNITSGYSQSLSSDIPAFMGNLNSISARNNTILLVAGSFGNVQIGLLNIKMVQEVSVRFLSSGLPAGEEWSVTFGGSTISSTTDSITAYETPGTYSYQVNPNPDFYSNISTGSVTVTDVSISLYIGWIREAYQVEFKEQGLAPGSAWSVTLAGSATSSFTGNIVFNMKNGTYGFSVNMIPGYTIFPAKGNLTVSGSNLNVTVYFYSDPLGPDSLFLNQTNSLYSDGIFWSGQVSSNNNVALYSGGNGLIKINNNGQLIGTVENGNTGYYSYSLYNGKVFFGGGNWYGPSGGINIIEYYPSNGTAINLDRYLPANWISNSYNSTVVSMAYGNSSLLVMKGSITNFNQPIDTGILENGYHFVNITSTLPEITYRASAAYGDGQFIILSTGAAYIYNLTTNTSTIISNVNPLYSSATIGANQFSTYLNGSFYFFNGSYLAKIQHNNANAKNIEEITNPLFITNLSGRIFVGNASSQYNAQYTEIGYLNGSSIKWVLRVNGQVTDMNSLGGGYLLSGDYISTFTPLLNYYSKETNLNISAQGILTGSEWGIFTDNVSLSTTDSYIDVIVPSSINGIHLLSPTGYSSKSQSINLPSSIAIYHNFNTTVNFIKEPTYSADFIANGLPTGEGWTISIGSMMYSSPNRYINLSMPNGTYSFQVSPVTGYVPVPPTGNFTISGNSVKNGISINFTSAQTYSISFSESGLTTGSEWGVVFNGISETSTSGTISFASLPGTFSYSIDEVSGYQASIYSGNLKVDSNSSVDVSYFTSSYLVTFTETGLPLQGVWSVSIGNNLFESNSTSLSTYLANGSYDFQVSGPVHYISNVTSGLLQINGQNSAISLSFTRTSDYEISFDESGLPTGSAWNVSIAGTNYLSNSSVIKVYYPNGTYQYTISSELSNYVPSNGAGSILVDGSTVTVFTNFTDPVYSASINSVLGTRSEVVTDFTDPSLIINETGFVFGHDQVNEWQINLNGKVYNMTGSENTFTLSQGLYRYSVEQIGGYAISPQSGYVAVNGSINYLNISFRQVPSYSVVFTPAGIPYGTSISITVNSVIYKFIPTAQIPYLTLTLPSGEYDYSVAAAGGYKPLSISGTIFVSNNQVQVSLKFVNLQLYPVKFVASGLASNSELLVSIGSSHYSSTSGNLELDLAPGIYSYSVASTGGEKPVIGSGEFQLTQTGYTVNIAYIEQNYLVIFKSQGITGISWKLSFASSNVTVSGNEAQFDVANGTYNYSIITEGQYVLVGATGTVKVSGSDVTVYPLFEREYKVYITESGLPANTVWYLNSTSSSYEFNSSSVNSITEINGSYEFTVSSSNKEWKYDNATEGFYVSGSNIIAQLQFSKVLYTVTFKENGLKTNETWEVQINGMTYRSSNSSISVNLSNGTYSYTVYNETGFSLSNGTASISVNGQSGTVTLNFTPQSKTPPPNNDYLIEIIVLAVVIVGAIAGFVAIRRIKK